MYRRQGDTSNVLKFRCIVSWFTHCLHRQLSLMQSQSQGDDGSDGRAYRSHILDL